MGYDVNKKTAKSAFDTTDTKVAINWAQLQCLNALALLSYALKPSIIGDYGQAKRTHPCRPKSLPEAK